MNVVVDGRVLAHPVYTGVENYTFNLCKALKQLDGLSLKCAVPSVGSNRYLLHLWNHFVLPWERGDILFCPANIAPIHVPKNKKLVITLHDIAFLRFSDTVGSLFGKYYRTLIPKILSRADAVVTISKYSKQEILHAFPHVEEKLHVIYQGIDPLFRPLGLEKKKQILYVGSFNARKNLKGVLQAFDKLQKPGWKLLLIGNFSSNFPLDYETSSALKHAKKNPHIHFLQNISKERLLLYYNESAFLVFPSFYEGFGLPPLEAMACGTPVIVSDISSMPEVCGDAALYCNPFDPNDILEKMKLLIEDKALRMKLADRGKKHAKFYDWQKSGTKMKKLFEEILLKI